MAKLLECIKELYGTSNLYEVLGVKSDASVANLKKAYYKISLQVHPDRVTEEEKQTYHLDDKDKSSFHFLIYPLHFIKRDMIAKSWEPINPGTVYNNRGT